MANATLITLLGTVKKCGAFKICHELPAAKDPDVTIAPGKKQVMLILYICKFSWNVKKSHWHTLRNYVTVMSHFSVKQLVS